MDPFQFFPITRILWHHKWHFSISRAANPWTEGQVQMSSMLMSNAMQWVYALTVIAHAWNSYHMETSLMGSCVTHRCQRDGLITVKAAASLGKLSSSDVVSSLPLTVQKTTFSRRSSSSQDSRRKAENGPSLTGLIVVSCRLLTGSWSASTIFILCHWPVNRTW